MAALGDGSAKLTSKAPKDLATNNFPISVAASQSVTAERSEESGLGRQSTQILRCAENDDLFGAKS